jgi:hypothetical protein
MTATALSEGGFLFATVLLGSRRQQRRFPVVASRKKVGRNESKKVGSKPRRPGKKKAIKLRFAVYLANGGDGSAIPHFFATEEQAQARADRDREEYGESFTDDVVMHEFEIDPETGTIVKGLEDPPKAPDEGDDDPDAEDYEDW